MHAHPSPSLSPRKEPRQERSRRMRACILDAALRVLSEEGAIAFTTTRVADAAGISVGSLYQYFPNKHALVVALHADAVRQGWEHVQQILDRPAWSARRKVVEIARWFFATESAEVAQMGAVFDDIEVFLRDGGGHDDFEDEVLERLARFLAEASPRRRTTAALRSDAELLGTTIESVGKAVATRQLPPAEADRWATRVATMLCDHLDIP